MSNTFKSNSRFSNLMDDISEKNDRKKENKKDIESSENHRNNFNSFKLDSSKKELLSPYNDKQRERRRQERAILFEEKEKEKERKNIESLSMDKFPDLFGNIKKDENIDNVKNEENKKIYIEKLKSENIKQNVYPHLETLQPGWVVFKRDPFKKRIIPERNIIEEKATANDILNKLVKLHENRTEEYIKNYGYDEWERIFKFPDWKEREAYLEEMEEMADQTDESDYDFEDDL